MKKFLKKVVTCLCVVILLITGSRPRTVKAEAMTIGGGLTYLAGAGAATASLPIIIIGLAAILILGLVVTNWDDIAAFGNAVSLELEYGGYALSDFVSGTSVKIDSVFKNAVLKAYQKTGSTMTKYYPITDYAGGTVVKTGLLNTKDRLDAAVYLEYLDHDFPYSMNVVNDIYGLSNLFLSNAPSEKWKSLNGDYTGINQYVLNSITIIASFEPTTAKVAFFNLINLGTQKEVRDENGNLTKLILSITAAEVAEFVGKTEHFSEYAAALASDKPITITDISIPELGIGSVREEISTANMMQTAMEVKTAEQYINVAFPNASTTVTFNTQANVIGATLPQIGTLSDYGLTGAQTDELARVRAGTATGTLTGAQTATGTLTGSGTGWLDKILEFLKKLLDAILAIPGLILDGLKALWDWLAKILQAILAIPGGIIGVLSKIWEFLQTLSKVISNAITSALTWAFGIDGTWLKGRIESLQRQLRVKFPTMEPLRYDFGDKDVISDMNISILGQSYTILDGVIATKLASPIKMVFRALSYILMALFFARKFHKVAED